MEALGQPDNRDDYDVQEYLESQLGEHPELLDRYPDFAQDVRARKLSGTSVIGEAVKGVKSGTYGLGATVAGLGAIAGIPGAADEAKSLEQKAAESAPVISSASDVSSVGDAARYAAGKAGEFIPSIAEMLGTAAAGAAIGSAIEPGVGTLAGAGEGAVEEILGGGLIKKAIKEAVERGALKMSEADAAAAIRAGDQAVADVVTKSAKLIQAGRAGEITNLANLYTQSAGGIYNETGNRETALELGAVGAAAGALPGLSLPRQVVKALFPKLAAEAADEAATKLVQTNAQKLLAKAGLLAKGTVSGTVGMVGMEAANIVAKNLTSGKAALSLDDSDWKRLREAAVGGALASAPFAALTLRSPRENAAPTAPSTLPAAESEAPPAVGSGESVSEPLPTPVSNPTLDLLNRIKAYTPDEARARLRQLTANTSRDESEEKEYQILQANAPSSDLPAPAPAQTLGPAPEPPAAAPEGAAVPPTPELPPEAPIASAPEPASAAPTPATQSVLGDQIVKIAAKRAKTGEPIEVEMPAAKAETMLSKRLNVLRSLLDCLAA